MALKVKKGVPQRMEDTDHRVNHLPSFLMIESCGQASPASSQLIISDSAGSS